MREHRGFEALGQAVALAEPPLIESSARTDVGVHRRVNEDAVFADGGVYVVADGMGGHEAGDLASAAAIEPFRALAAAHGARDYRMVEATIELARRAVDTVSLRTERGAGCTLTGVVLIEHGGIPHWYVMNVGDSRVYLHSGAELTQLTVDHSLHAELLAEGRAEAADTPRNVITRALGSGDSRHDAWLLPVHAGGASWCALTG
ncbi:PP2C family protein-serine/threonine phosphatase [Leucobacter insecticola]|uniref:PP2C family protein-serine/threonine phosphatase n=1 Tax=Leucobacter insecticola TaxID=2714934 RepID=UPI001FCC94A6|nr:protein phosphatase 2C domain-containing protein [Leucobacter insecticola]